MDLKERVLNLNIDGVVEIPQCGIYAKSPEALKALLIKLGELGYNIKDCGKDKDRPAREEQEKKGWYLWYASLRDDVIVRKGKCKSCGSYIDTRGIESHKNKCEVCGAYTYLKFVNGSKIRFFFTKDARGETNPMEPDISMTVFDYDEILHRLLLYPEPNDGNNFNDWNRANAKRVLEANSKQYRKLPAKPSKSARKHIRRLKSSGYTDEIVAFKKQKCNRRFGIPLIAMPYDPYSFYVGVINTSEIIGHKYNHRVVKLYNGKEYSDWDSLPVPESLCIYEAWHWAPLGLSENLHEKIISAAGMVSDCGYYYQDGRTDFYDIHLLRMRIFVENFTTIPIEQWDRLIDEEAPRSGPGMIKAIASFCQNVNPDEVVVEDRPNIGNLMVGFCKVASGKRLIGNEAKAMEAALKDKGIREDFLEVINVNRNVV